MSSFTSVRRLLGEPSSSLTFQFSQRPYHVMSLSNQRRASSARCARVAGCEEPCRSCTPLPRLPASARYSRACTQGVGLAASARGGLSRSHACTRRKAAEEVISLSSCGGSKSALSRKREKKRELGIFFCSRSSVRLREDLAKLRNPQAENSVLFNPLLARALCR